jgi:hypothetical protein
MVARDHYMRGMWHFHQFREEESGNAIACFERAIELDDTMAEAYVGIARALLSRIMYGFHSERDANVEKVSAAARKALALDPTNANACYATLHEVVRPLGRGGPSRNNRWRQRGVPPAGEDRELMSKANTVAKYLPYLRRYARAHWESKIRRRLRRGHARSDGQGARAA